MRADGLLVHQDVLSGLLSNRRHHIATSQLLPETGLSSLGQALSLFFRGRKIGA